MAEKQERRTDWGYPGDGGVGGNLPPGLLFPDLLVFIIQILHEGEEVSYFDVKKKNHYEILRC